MEVSFHPEAIADAVQSRAWYAARSPRAAAAFEVELDRAIARLREAPLRWPPFGQGTRKVMLRRFPIAVIYRVGMDEIQVLAVAHLHRRPGFWNDRVPGR
jgi:plasmid stabilization system protein ParE